MDLKLLYKKFKNAKNSEEISECIIEALKFREVFKNSIPTKLVEILDCGNVLLYQLSKMINEKNIARAEFLANTFFSIAPNIPPRRFFIYYLFGRMKYISGDYVRATKFFMLQDKLRLETVGGIDELSLFYRANCLAMQTYFLEAAEIYKQILEIKSDFPEVQKNLEIVNRYTNENLVLEVSSLWNFCEWQDVPIFINSRDRVGVMKKLIDWLLDAGYRNLIILDNNSTYEGLLNYYSELEKDSRIKIIRLEKNFGFKAIWLSNVLETLKISTPYIYTDPDVVPVDNCPKDFVKRLFEILDSNHEIRKVGLSLIWEDITISDKKKLQATEEKFFKNCRIGENLSFANVDTTFALYSNLRSYSLRLAVRTYGDFRCRHLPWYYERTGWQGLPGRLRDDRRNPP